LGVHIADPLRGAGESTKKIKSPNPRTAVEIRPRKFRREMTTLSHGHRGPANIFKRIIDYARKGRLT